MVLEVSGPPPTPAPSRTQYSLTRETFREALPWTGPLPGVLLVNPLLLSVRAPGRFCSCLVTRGSVSPCLCYQTLPICSNAWLSLGFCQALIKYLLGGWVDEWGASLAAPASLCPPLPSQAVVLCLSLQSPVARALRLATLLPAAGLMSFPTLGDSQHPTSPTRS